MKKNSENLYEIALKISSDKNLLEYSMKNRSVYGLLMEDLEDADIEKLRTAVQSATSAVDQNLNCSQLMNNANLNWNVEMKPVLFAKDGNTVAPTSVSWTGAETAKKDKIVKIDKKNEINETDKVNEIAKKDKKDKIVKKDKKNKINETDKINKKDEVNEIAKKDKKDKKDKIDETEKVNETDETNERDKKEKINKMKKKKLNIKYKLDIEDCIKKYINNDIEKQILSTIKIIDKNCFYIKLEDKIYSSIWGYMDLWLTIENYGNNLWGVSDTNENCPLFIKYKESIM